MRDRRVTAGVFSVTLLLHAALIVGLLIAGRSRPVRVSPGPVSQVGIAAFNPGPVGTGGTSPTPAAPAPKKPAPTRAARAMQPPEEPPANGGQTGGAAGVVGGAGGGGSGPVRLGSGEGLTLLQKVTPTYPHVLEAAKIHGVVVLEAIIHRDGTIGDINVLRSTHDAFARAAVDAVKQWRYSPLPFEGLVTVTVNFILPH